MKHRLNKDSRKCHNAVILNACTLLTYCIITTGPRLWILTCGSPYLPFLHDRQVDSGHSVPLIEDGAYHNEAYVDHENSGSGGMTGRPRLYAKKDEKPPPSSRTYGCRDSGRPTLQDMLPILVIPDITTSIKNSSSVLTNGKTNVSFMGEEGPRMAEEVFSRKEEGYFFDISNDMETREDILMPVQQQDTFGNKADETPEKSVEDICYQDTSVGPAMLMRIDEDDGDDDVDVNPYKAMLSDFCYSDDEDTVGHESSELKHKYEQFTSDQKVTGLEAEGSTEKSFEVMKENENKTDQNLRPSTTGLLNFVDSIEF